MNRILKVYLRNIFKQKGYYVCLIISVLLSIVLPYTISSLGIITTDTPLGNIIASSLTVDIFQIIFITLFVCTDFNEGAAKNYIARGYTRRQILFSKYIASLIAVFCFYLVYTVFNILLFYNNGFGFTSTNIIMIVGNIIVTFAIVGFYVIIANTLEKLSLAMTANILLNSFLTAIVTGVIMLLKVDPNIANYWITNLSGLIPETNAGIIDIVKVLGITILYLVILFELSNFIIKRKEVK